MSKLKIRKTFGSPNFLWCNTQPAVPTSQNVVCLNAGQTSGIQLAAGMFKNVSANVTLNVK